MPRKRPALGSTRASVPTPEQMQERWERGTMLSAATRAATDMDRLRDVVEQMDANLHHIHGDLVALREALRVPRPECYPRASPQRREAKKLRETPPPDPQGTGE